MFNVAVSFPYSYFGIFNIVIFLSEPATELVVQTTPAPSVRSQFSESEWVQSSRASSFPVQATLS